VCKTTRNHALVKEPEWEAKIDLARKCAFILAHALDAVHVPFDMYTYTSTTQDAGWRVLSAVRDRSSEECEMVQRIYTRFSGHKIQNVKTFDETWSRVSWRLSLMKAEQANYDGESLRVGVQRLTVRSAKRKVLFVLCDGTPGPCPPEREADHRDYLHKVVKGIRDNTPVELVCVGIGAPQAAQFYAPNFVNVSNVSELPVVVAKQLRNALLGKKG
jgi:cobalamin biosynthesis protein CobT